MVNLRAMTNAELRSLYVHLQRQIEAATDRAEKQSLRAAQKDVYEEWHYKRYVRRG